MESWEKINAVQRMQDYVLGHLREEISMLNLSRVAGYSPYHSARIFKELVGQSPFEYIRKLRLTQAALRLRDENVKIIDVAFDFVFNSHEGFTKAFSKQFGIAPKAYNKTTPPIGLFLPYRIRDLYLNILEGGRAMSENEKTSTVFVQVIDRPARKLILKRGKTADDYFTYCEEMGCDVWGVLSSIKEALYEPIGMWLPKKLRPEGTSRYVQGVELPINYTGIVPEGFELIDLVPCKMMVFQGEPFEDEQFSEAIGKIWNAMKTYDPAVYGFKWADEEAPRFQLEPIGYRGYIEARPVKSVG